MATATVKAVACAMHFVHRNGIRGKVPGKDPLYRGRCRTRCSRSTWTCNNGSEMCDNAIAYVISLWFDIVLGGVTAVGSRPVLVTECWHSDTGVDTGI